MRKAILAAIAALALSPAAASAATYSYTISTAQEYGLLTGTLSLTDDSSGLITGGSAALTGAGLSGTVDFSVITTATYCGGTCYGGRAGDGTDFYGFTNSYTGSKLNDVVLASSATSGNGYVLGIYNIGAGQYENGLFGPGGAQNFYSDGAPISITAAPEPSTWAMILVGFAGLAFAARRGARAQPLPA